MQLHPPAQDVRAPYRAPDRGPAELVDIEHAADSGLKCVEDITAQICDEACDGATHHEEDVLERIDADDSAGRPHRGARGVDVNVEKRSRGVARGRQAECHVYVAEPASAVPVV